MFHRRIKILPTTCNQDQFVGVEFNIMRRAKWIVIVVAVIALVVLLRYTIFAPDIVEVRTAAV